MNQTEKEFWEQAKNHATRFAASYRDRLRYCKEWDCWFMWDGKRWAKLTVEQIHELGRKFLCQSSLL